jgi:hypothetical protein
VSDFPFERPEHRAAWLAGLLTPLAWFAFDGPAPLYRLRIARPQAGVNPTRLAAPVAESGSSGRVTSHRTCQRVFSAALVQLR